MVAEEMRREYQKRLKRRLIIEGSVLGVCLLVLGIKFVLSSPKVDDLKYKLNDIDCTVSFPDMKYGDSVYIECEGETALIDLGTKEHSEELMSFIASNNIKKIDYIFIPDIEENYIDVLDDVLNTVDVFRIILPSDEKYNSLCDEIDNLAFTNSLLNVKANDGQTFPLCESFFNVVECESLSLKFWFGKNSFLFWNSSDENKEIDFIESSLLPDADVLWIASDRILSDNFLGTVSPQFCVVADCAGISDVSAFEKFADKVYKAGSIGNITISSNEVDLDIKLENQ